MTIDERIVSRVQSTESLHQTASEMRAQIQEHTKQLEIDADNNCRLANIAAAHEGRLDSWEGKQ